MAPRERADERDCDLVAHSAGEKYFGLSVFEQVQPASAAGAGTQVSRNGFEFIDIIEHAVCRWKMRQRSIGNCWWSGI
jgi:hypothetical protein